MKQQHILRNCQCYAVEKLKKKLKQKKTRGTKMFVRLKKTLVAQLKLEVADCCLVKTVILMRDIGDIGIFPKRLHCSDKNFWIRCFCRKDYRNCSLD